MAERTGNDLTNEELGVETEDNEETDLMDALRATAAERREGVSMTKQRKLELDPVLDYMINADVQPGLKCRRKVFDLYFDNKAAGENSQIPTITYVSQIVQQGVLAAISLSLNPSSVATYTILNVHITARLRL
ncbi:hypothetical protein SERLA73DRAFT_76398 [Serpula lacrymans var. lacrymans S7.3]|uniref:Uncharacterized protein n=2 Tax=Serpula lacrymans var. lacrymans TaxID=341189 RepID=F8Q5G3_SERL3|nr:uncharacterized protein SERLADRAFT_441214 [Serpula lacrymans var. lacrymans S7.9]EGN96434.1 hypothetical protein SERLA73DRAFT_76398 [Serpula lacrymans var. lacrymans S7.3]EGO21985.1 hypothetical protein SERLADRAFT_441214 [Serpula lacrymans var. lacrymans S7.9]